ncbi:MAG TPA: proline racemase family protein [Candidatus Limnocylindrales bacterium]|nr:proline racemase family protein [Candidatus Limnocylindrales bacterium]
MVRSRLTLQAIDLHCGGEPLRLVTAGYPPVPVAPVLERRRWVQEHADHVRQALMYEPRGHRDMYGAVLLPPGRPDADLTVLFMHNAGYSTMCGHGTIAIATALVEEGLIPAHVPETTIRLEAPCGIVVATAATRWIDSQRGMEGGAEVTGVRFENVPSYLHARDLAVHPDGLGLDRPLAVDLAYGGAYYGIVDAAALGLRVVPEQVEALTRAGAAITEVLRRDHTPSHPQEADLGFVYGTIIVDGAPATAPDGRAREADIRNVTIFAAAEVDRSPCGSGTSAILAARATRGLLAAGQTLRNASITGAIFEGRVEGPAFVGASPAWWTSVAGTAYVTGYGTYVVDARDPLGGGFLLR